MQREWIHFPLLMSVKLMPKLIVNGLASKLEKHIACQLKVNGERAASSTDGRIYPWGDTFDPWRCNTQDSGKPGPTPVGTYSPAGDSPVGAVDMAGNVYEWTSDILFALSIRRHSAFSSQRYSIRCPRRCLVLQSPVGALPESGRPDGKPYFICCRFSNCQVSGVTLSILFKSKPPENFRWFYLKLHKLHWKSISKAVCQ